MNILLRNRIGFGIFGFLLYTIWNFIAQTAVNLIEDHLKDDQHFENKSTTENGSIYLLSQSIKSNERTTFCHNYSNLMTVMFAIVSIARLTYPILLIRISESRRMIMSFVCYFSAIILIGSSSNIIVVILGSVLNGAGYGISMTTVLIMTKAYGNDFALTSLGVGYGICALAGFFDYNAIYSILHKEGTIFINLIGIFVAWLTYIKLIERIPELEHPYDSYELLQSHTRAPGLQESLPSNMSSPMNPNPTKASENRSSSSINQAHIMANNNLENSFDDVSSTMTLKQKYHMMPKVLHLLCFGLLEYSADYFVISIFPLFYPADIAGKIRGIGMAIAMASFGFIRIKRGNLPLVSGLMLLIAVVFFFRSIGVIPFPGIVIGGTMLVFEGLSSGMYYMNSFDELNNHYDGKYHGFFASVLSNANSLGALTGYILSVLIGFSIC